MGPYSSPVTEASVNVTEKYKKVMVAPLAATTSIFKRPPDKKRHYVFMVISPAEVYLEGLIDTAAKRGLKTVAVVNEDTLFSKAAARAPSSPPRSAACRSTSRRRTPRATPTSARSSRR